MASRPAPAGTGISTAISAPAANPGPLSPAQARASRLQVCACVAAASDSGVHVPRAVLVIRSARPHCMPLPLLHPAGFCVQRGSAARTTTASLGPGCHISRQPPWRPQYLTGTSVLREALKYCTTRTLAPMAFSLPPHLPPTSMTPCASCPAERSYRLMVRLGRGLCLVLYG